jgi:transcriptional regulator of arginine metabolism
MNMKARRQAAVLALVEQQQVRSQDDLRRLLSKRGFRATQATLSRDIRDLGLVKRSADGAYRRGDETADPSAAAAVLQRAVADYMTDIQRSEQLVVVKTNPGHAQLLALAIDRAGLPEVIGTVAGDDTILVICHGVRQGAAVFRRFDSFTTR